MFKIYSKIMLGIVVLFLSGCISEKKVEIKASGSQVPWWTKNREKHEQYFVYFTGKAIKEKSLKTAKWRAVEDGARVILSALGVKDERVFPELVQEYAQGIFNTFESPFPFRGIKVYDSYYRKYKKGNMVYFDFWVRLQYEKKEYEKACQEMKKRFGGVHVPVYR